MKRNLLAVCLALMLAGSSSAEDLAKIDRSVAKEPEYKTKTPRYCLLVLGQQADTRIWLVFDGDVLYIDRNGNGDLTDAEDKVEGEVDKARQDLRCVTYKVGEIVEKDGKTKHANFHINCPGSSTYFTLDTARLGKQQCGYDGQGGQLTPAASAKEAPIVHFNGPLTMTWNGAAPKFKRGDKPSDLRLTLATPGVGKGTLVSLQHAKVPGKLLPTVDVEFPPEKDGEPIKEQMTLPKRC